MASLLAGPGILALSAASLGIQIASMARSAQAAEAQQEALEAQGEEEEKQERRRGAQLRGSQRVAFAKSGVDESGTALDILGRAAEDAELNALRTRFGFDQRSALVEEQQNQRQLQGIADIGGTILGTVGALHSAGAFAPKTTSLPGRVPVHHRQPVSVVSPRR